MLLPCMVVGCLLVQAEFGYSAQQQLLEKANSFFVARQFEKARVTAVSLLDTDPNNASALKIKGNSEYFLGDFEKSISTFVTLLDRHPDDEEGAYMLGRIYYQEDRYDQAIGQFQRLIGQNPTAYKAWDNLGLCWEAKGDTGKATAHFLKAIQLVETSHPEYDWAYANLADLLIKTGDWEHAFAAASKATQRNSTSARNFYLGAKALDKLDKTELCLNWLQRAVALNPNYSESQYLLVRVYTKLGRKNEAEEARKKFLEIKAREPAKRR